MVLCSLSLSFLHSTSQASTFLPRSSQLFSGIRPNGPTGIVSICFSSYSIPVPPCFFYSLFDIFIRCSPVSLFFTAFTRFPIFAAYIHFIYNTIHPLRQPDFRPSPTGFSFFLRPPRHVLLSSAHKSSAHETDVIPDQWYDLIPAHDP